ncbi:bifunctional phosphoribosylaminoimidazolecarboxamide formyltransferase/IMP cyclohydrolase [Hamadaea tsunoensis]|uniref:bifunctional phosphoribosylaminoimidazolecarboxamide formyltransferase/IMP cyclohydrolase n=1 Tax=Hamadaea tsunoensis TaxID=53368 RepID=UPI00041AB5F6|nr:bifunctional phosphoribosylaminoimidazolecarboxamide formyltransferase/IMP cyclohydrolase [Hamadaea tsunoensis]
MTSAERPDAERLDDVGDGRRPFRRVLISVDDKNGLPGLVRALRNAGAEIFATGSTANAIEDMGPPCNRVEDLTGFGEALGGRVKTLHPNVHAGLLADMTDPAHVAELERLGIEPFDLLVSNLYPFRKTVDRGGSLEECIEKIDIGGPAMVRAAAKNSNSIAVVISPTDYPFLIGAAERGGFTLKERRALAARAYGEIADYDLAIAQWTGVNLVELEDTAPGANCWPEFGGIGGWRTQVLRYGENPHQAAALYMEPWGAPGLARSEQLGGKEMSYNNFVDADAAWAACNAYEGVACVAIVKHNNPCGIAISAESVADAHRKAHACDPMSAYGGVIASNVVVTAEMARQLDGVFTEVIVAPGYEEEAAAILTAKKNLRTLVAPPYVAQGVQLRQISGGFLAQTADLLQADGDNVDNWRLVTGEPATPEQLDDLEFAWGACKYAKSNAILLAKNGGAVGIGMGQVNRVDSVRLAISRANTLADGEERARGSVCASDAYFPFPDNIELLGEAGITAIVCPGGSIRDDQAIEAAEKAGITMYFTGSRHFWH